MAKTMIAAWKAALLPAAALMAAVPGAAWAQAAATAPSDSAMVNLVRLLIEQGVITRDKGTALMQQALTEAQTARATAPTQTAQLPAPAAGTVRVPYIPETVRAQIKEELRTEVLAQAKSEGWATPGEGAPDWTRRITLYGDIRVRSESDLFNRSNADDILDLARFNSRGPTDLTTAIPFLNTRQDRWNRLRLRARLGIHADIAPMVEAGILLATGDDNGPISNNTSLGGGFGKREFWLQEAWLKVKPTDWSSVTLGRMRNPFVSTDLMFDPDLDLDGLEGEVRFADVAGSGASLAVRGGAFPLDFGDANFQSTSQNKQKYPDRYMFSAQAEVDVPIGDKLGANVAVAYHNFTNLQGAVSEPCLLFAGATECSTDYLAPNFLTKGNTVFFLRNIPVDPTLQPGQVQPLPQLFGLTFDYDILDITGSVRFPVTDSINAKITGNYVRNLSFRRGDVCRFGSPGGPFNNTGSDGNVNRDVCDTTNPTSFVGGNEGYQGIVQVGYDKPGKRGEWQAFGGYRYLQSDAVLASLTDSDFHLGGTNAKGFFVGGKVGLLEGVSFGGRYMSANEIAGEPLSIDVLLLDLNAAF